MPVSTDDWVSLNDFMGRYCWAVDDGESEKWSQLFTEDAEFVGIAPEPVKGREALSKIPTHAFEAFQGNMRHLYSNFFADYGADKNTVHAQIYQYVSIWGQEARNFTMTLCKITFQRNGDSWLIKRNEARNLAPPMEGLDKL